MLFLGCSRFKLKKDLFSCFVTSCTEQATAPINDKYWPHCLQVAGGRVP